MGTKIVALPGDTLWWIVRPEFIAFVDTVIFDEAQFQYESNQKDRSGFHRLAWDRLNVLLDQGVLEVRDLKVPADHIASKARELISSILSHAEWRCDFAKDLVFAYDYWIRFNQMKIDVLPDNQEYTLLIAGLMESWKNDLEILKQRGSRAFEERPQIIEHVATRILEKTLTLDFLSSGDSSFPMAALKEYEPFSKWAFVDYGNPIATEVTALTYLGEIPYRSSLTGAINLPQEPEFDFLRFNLSKKRFSERMKNIFGLYKTFRLKTYDLVRVGEEILFGLREQRLQKTATDDYFNIVEELRRLSARHRRSSARLSLAFSGLSLLPIPVFSQAMNAIAMGAGEISAINRAVELEERGFQPKGLSAFYSFYESLLSKDRSPEFAEVANSNHGWQSPASGAPFWRVGD